MDVAHPLRGLTPDSRLVFPKVPRLLWSSIPRSAKTCHFARKTRIWRHEAFAFREPGARRAIPDDSVEKVL
jgi:hypothetical protein